MKEIREQEQDKSKVQELTKTYYDNEYKPAYMAMLKDFIDKTKIITSVLLPFKTYRTL